MSLHKKRKKKLVSIKEEKKEIKTKIVCIVNLKERVKSVIKQAKINTLL